VRAFAPDGSFRDVGAAVNEDGFFADWFHLFEVNFLEADGAVAVVFDLADRLVAVGDVALAVVIEEKGGIDAADEGAHHIENAVVIADGRGVRAGRDLAAPHGELRGTVDDIADLCPVDQVPGVPDGNAGEVIKG
jgi:hypothetical protein